MRLAYRCQAGLSRAIVCQRGHGREPDFLKKVQVPLWDKSQGPQNRSSIYQSFTAAIMASLDLVVPADTATAHLAGALAVPVWVALAAVADWRWLWDREETPWFPTMLSLLCKKAERGGPLMDARA
jgi:hypothetical protein